jgi:hypothetical protein
MAYTLEFRDSEVGEVTVEGAAVRIRLSAAAVRTAEGERGWLSSAVLDLRGVSSGIDPGGAFGRIAEGRLRVDGRELIRAGLPQALAGDVELALRLANGTALLLRGRTLDLSAARDARFVPDLSC